MKQLETIQAILINHKVCKLVDYEILKIKKNIPDNKLNRHKKMKIEKLKRMPPTSSKILLHNPQPLKLVYNIRETKALVFINNILTMTGLESKLRTLFFKFFEKDGNENTIDYDGVIDIQSKTIVLKRKGKKLAVVYE